MIYSWSFIFIQELETLSMQNNSFSIYTFMIHTCIFSEVAVLLRELSMHNKISFLGHIPGSSKNFQRCLRTLLLLVLSQFSRRDTIHPTVAPSNEALFETSAPKQKFLHPLSHLACDMPNPFYHPPQQYPRLPWQQIPREEWNNRVCTNGS